MSRPNDTTLHQTLALGPDVRRRFMVLDKQLKVSN